MKDLKVLRSKGGQFVSRQGQRAILTDNINVAYSWKQEDAEIALRAYEDELNVSLEIKPLLDYYKEFKF